MALARGEATAGQILTISTDFKGGAGQLVALPIVFNDRPSSEYAGAFSTTVQGGSTFDTFCIDLYDSTYPGATWQVTAAPIGTFAGNAASDPMGGHGDAIGALYSRFVADDSDRIKAAALQLAIWKVEYDGTTSLSTGYFQFADSSDPSSDQHLVYAQLMSDFNGFDPDTAEGPGTLLAATSHPNGLYQDLVGPAQSNQLDTLATPEPATLTLAFTALVALIVRWVIIRRGIVGLR